MKIFKYEVVPTSEFGRQGVDMHKGARILSASFMCGRLYVWALVDPEQPKVTKTLCVFGTGVRIPPELNIENCRFIGTTQDSGLVLHVFEQV